MLRMFFSLVLMVVAVAAEAGSFAKGDIPEWVEIIDLPAPNPANMRYTDEGTYYLLTDRQVRWDGETQQFVSRLALEILDRSGVEAAAVVSRIYDPAFEDLDLLSMHVIRDGEAIDHKGLHHQEFRRETALDRGIVDGRMTVHFDLPDVRVGDIVDVTFMWTSRPHIPGATFEGAIDMSYSVPVGLARATLHWPSGTPLHLGTMSDEVVYSIENQGDTVRHSWVREDLPPPRGEPQMAYGAGIFDVLSYSSRASWDEVASSLDAYYADPHPVPVDWTDAVAAIAAATSDPAERTRRALRLVQEDIRYVGIEIGAGGYYARRPETVVQNGFGDCKDKSVLLQSILAELGVEATVALARLSGGYSIGDEIPRASVFDHMIVGAKLDGAMVWMDPTGSYQAGIPGQTAVTPDYGFVLPLSHDRDELTPIAVASDMLDRMHTEETIEFNWRGVALTVVTEYFGEAADNTRWWFADNALESIQQDYLEYYHGHYPGIELTSDFEIKDDLVGNTFTVREEYRLPRAALNDQDLFTDFGFYSDDFASYFPNNQIGKRRTPLSLRQVVRKHTVKVRNAPIEFRPPEDRKISNSGFDWSFIGTASKGGNMDLVWRFQTKTPVLEPGDVNEVIRSAEEISDNWVYAWDLRADETGDAPKSLWDSVLDRIDAEMSAPTQ